MTENTQSSTIIGLFESYRSAQAAARELGEAGIPRENIHVQSNQATGAAGYGSTQDNPEQRDEGGIRGFFHRLFGSDEERGNYAEAIRRGDTVVAVSALPNQIESVTRILNNQGAIDIDSRVAAYRESGWRGYDPKAPAYTAEESEREREKYRKMGGTQTIPVVEEEIAIGKRVVRRGGVRVYSHIVEEPVQQEVNLREEHARVERRPANRELTPQEAGSLRDQTIEVTESIEEPVISKRARVTEEVVVGKDVTNRTEKISDKVRRTKVEVEKLGNQEDAAKGGGRE